MTALATELVRLQVDGLDAPQRGRDPFGGTRPIVDEQDPSLVAGVRGGIGAGTEEFGSPSTDVFGRRLCHRPRNRLEVVVRGSLVGA